VTVAGRNVGTRARRHVAVVLGLTLLAVAGAGRSLAAQVNLPTVLRSDTVAADLLAIDSLLGTTRPSPWRQTVIMRAAWRLYDVGSPSGVGRSVDEQAGGISYQLRGPRLGVRIDVSPVSYTAVQRTSSIAVAGTTPTALRVDWRWHDGDTTRVYLRSPSSPTVLDSAQAAAIGAAGTSTIELEATALGVQPLAGVRQTIGIPLSEDVTLSLRGAAEWSPRPSGASDVYWTGSTLRGGVSVSQRWLAGGLLGASFDVTRSWADSLGGHNLYPGGGSMSFEGRARGPLDGPTGRFFADVQTGYALPFGNIRADQPTRLIPQGTFFNLIGALTVRLQDVDVTPILGMLREASSATARRAVASQEFSGAAWSNFGGVALSLPWLDNVDFIPEISYVRGNVSQQYYTVLLGRRVATATTTINYPTSGWVLSAELAIRF
jgi:hypothetical protein